MIESIEKFQVIREFQELISSKPPAQKSRGLRSQNGGGGFCELVVFVVARNDRGQAVRAFFQYSGDIKPVARASSSIDDFN